MSEKRHTEYNHELELLVPDYLNGHVNSDERAAVEQAMSNNAPFKAFVEQERELLLSMTRSEPAVGAQPDFSKVAEKIDARSRWMPFGLGGAAVAACAMVLAVGVTGWMNAQPTLNQFETLSSPEFTREFKPEATTVRLIGAEGVSAEEIELVIAKYDASILQQFPSLRVYDVSLEHSDRVQTLIDALSNDARFISVNQISETQP